MFGMSANRTGQGQRSRVEDMLRCVDIVVDYGLQKWPVYGRSGVNFDAENMRVLRMDAGYETFRDRIFRWFPQLLEEPDVDLVEDPDHRIGARRTL